MTTGFSRAVLVCVLIASAATAEDGAHRVRSLSFTIRVDASRADRVREILSRVAEPEEVVVPIGTAPNAYLKEICGERAPRGVEQSTADVDGTTVTRLRFAPCLRERRDVKVVARPNDTLESLAVRLGMHASAAKQLGVVRGDAEKPQPIRATELRIGDEVVAPSVPAWTAFRANPEFVRDRADLIAQLATALECGSESAEECLVRQGVILLNDPVAEPSPRPEADWQGAAAAQPDRIAAASSEPPRRDARLAAAMVESGGVAAVARTFAPEPTIPVAAPVLPAAAPAPLTRVAEDQWPYDKDLVVAALKDAMERTDLSPTLIGVADGGLAGANGAPLPADFFIDDFPDPPPPDNADTDGNSFVDDTIGAGTARETRGVTDQILGNGDLALCDSNPAPFAGWTEAPLVASHGAIVASVASGRAIRTAEPAVTAAMPRIVFFRLLPRACSASDPFGSSSQPAVVAFEYFRNREAPIVNVSSLADSDDGRSLGARFAQLLAYREQFLILPAGNESADFDSTPPPCPACLMDSTQFPGADRSVLVVGAATKELERSPSSNHGARVVLLYAPGEPSGALDVKGAEATGVDAATSYAAPLVSLAAAMLRTFKIDSFSKMRTRLLLSTWPLYVDGKPVPDIGVLDLTRIASAFHDSIEVLETDAHGTQRYRTYVGELTGGLHSLSLCGRGVPYYANAVHGIRLYPAGQNGMRRLHFVYRANETGTDRPQVRRQTCRPDGELRFKDLHAVERTFPLTEVTQILMPAVLHP